MRILHVTTVAATLRAFLLPIANHFRMQGCRVDGLANGAILLDGCTPPFDHLYDIQWTRSPFDLRNLIRAIRQIRSVVAEGQYDIVHIHTPIAAFVGRAALAASRWSGSRPIVIYTAHGFHFHPGGSALGNLVFRLAEQVAGRWTDYLVVINQEDFRAAQRYHMLEPDRIVYMPGIGVDTDAGVTSAKMAKRVRETRCSLGLDGTQPVFLMVGEISSNKNHKQAIDALSSLHRPDAILLCAGSGPLLESMMARARRRGVSQQVRFLGQRDDVPVLMRLANALISVSYREGLPRGVLEAMACGLPVLGTNIRGTAELLSDGCGRLVEVGDVAALAAEMRWVVENPTDARAMASRALRKAGAFSISRVLVLHERLYQEALRTRDSLHARTEVVVNGSQ